MSHIIIVCGCLTLQPTRYNAVDVFIRAPVINDIRDPDHNETGQHHEHAKPLVEFEAFAEECYRQQTGEDDDGSSQHLEAGGEG